MNVWRGQAEHLADSLAKGDRGHGHRAAPPAQLGDPEGDKRSVTELEADEVGASLKWATAKVGRVSRVFKGRGELIDHVFASHRLVNPANLPTVQTIRSVEPLPSIGDDPTSRRNEPGSDHAAVVATFTL